MFRWLAKSAIIAEANRGILDQYYQHSVISLPVPLLIPVLVKVNVVHLVSLAWGVPVFGVAVKVNSDAAGAPDIV